MIAYFILSTLLSLLREDDLLLIVFSLAVKHDLLADDLYRSENAVRSAMISASSPGIIGTVLEHADLDQFPGCERL